MVERVSALHLRHAVPGAEGGRLPGRPDGEGGRVRPEGRGRGPVHQGRLQPAQQDENGYLPRGVRPGDCCYPRKVECGTLILIL